MVSAIITTHKRSPEIVERALQSVLNQTWLDLEVIVVDDSPADFEQRDAVGETVHRLSAASGRPVQYIRHETCRGACVARNTGLASARGEFVAFLDDDDEWLPRKIERQMEKMTDGVGLVYCSNIDVNDGTQKQTIKHRKARSGRIFGEVIAGNFIGSTSFPLLRKEAVERAGGFDPEMKSAQDGDLWVRVTKLYDAAFVDEPLAIYHKHTGEQISKNTGKKIAGLELFNQKNMDYLEANPPVYWIRNMKLLPFYVRNGERGKALKTWWRAVRRCPGKVKGNVKYLYLIVTGRLPKKK